MRWRVNDYILGRPRITFTANHRSIYGVLIWRNANYRNRSPVFWCKEHSQHALTQWRKDGDVFCLTLSPPLSITQLPLILLERYTKLQYSSLGYIPHNHCNTFRLYHPQFDIPCAVCGMSVCWYKEFTKKKPTLPQFPPYKFSINARFMKADGSER